MTRRRILAALALAAVAAIAAAYLVARPPRMTPGPMFGKCIFASPRLLPSGERELILVAAADGLLAAVDPRTNEVAWRHQIEPPWGEANWLLATPVVVDGKIVVAYQTYSLLAAQHTSHRVVVLDAQAGGLDPDFAPLELAARVPAADADTAIEFDPTGALSRAALAHARSRPDSLGFVYVSFDTVDGPHPRHGWVFEIDLDAWRRRGAAAAIRSALPTTRSAGCPGQASPPASLCGGGVSAARGPKVRALPGGFELLVPVGTGGFDLARADYAFTMMRIEPGLRFEPRCDARLCAGAGATRPTRACAESCANLFVPRLLPGDAPLDPASGTCAGVDFHDCLRSEGYAFDSSPVRIRLDGGREVLALAGKDGALYLIDADHLGTLYDREQITALCGTAEDPCRLGWAGTIATEPALTEVDGVPVVIVPTFVPDRTHPAGLVAVKILARDGAPRFEPFWRAPQGRDAVENFRLPTGGVTLTTSAAGRRLAWVAEGFNLWSIDVRDGSVVERVPLDLRSIRFAEPLAHGGRLYLPLCKSDERGSRLDSYPYDAGGE
jgi:hypothetical protein